MNLVNSNEAFYFQDFRSVDQKNMIDRDYRIFNYRLASYTDFLAPVSRYKKCGAPLEILLTLGSKYVTMTLLSIKELP